jgi:malate/lactate dehydrogenase
MHTVAILGAGHLGGALARTLASGDGVSRILLIDDARSVAMGKALDIRQTGPIESYDTVVEGTDDVHAAAGVDLVVLADRHGQAELSGDATLPLLDRVAGLAPAAPLVLAGASHHALMTLAIKELKLPTQRLIGSASVAAVAAARALMAPALDASPVDIGIPIVGLPPAWVLVWDRACSAGAPVEMPPHAAARVEQLLAASWPPGPYSLASAASSVIRAALAGSRRRFCCFQAIPFGSVHPVVFAAPVTLGPSGIVAVALPELTPRQRVALESTVLARS